MDTASARATLRVEPVNSNLPSVVEPFFLQKHKGYLMQYNRDPAHIGRQITQIVLSSPDPETVLQRIAQAVGEIFQADACSVAAVSTNQALLKTSFWCVDDYAAIPIDPEAQLLETSALFEVEAVPHPLAIPDIKADKTNTAIGRHYRKLPFRAVLIMPTRFQNQLNGAIFVGRSLPGDWSESEKELLKVVSEPVAIAISQVQLHRQVRTATKHQNAIEQLTMAIRTTFDIDRILHQAVASTAQALQVDRGLILLLKYSDPLWKRDTLKHIPKAKATIVSQWPNLEEAKNLPQEQQNSHALLNHSFWLSDCPWSLAAFINSPSPLVRSDSHSLPPSEKEHKCIFTIADTMPALLMFPLLGTKSDTSVQSTILGFLVLQHSQPREWQPDELDLVNWVSAQASSAIIQSQTLQQVQALVEERTAQLQSSLEVQAKLYEKTRQQIDQLRHLNQLKDEFLSTVSHELRTPLTNMALAIRMLRQPELPSERRAKYLDILEQQCTQEIKLINDLLTLQQLESNHSPIQLQKIDLKQLVGNLAESFEQRWGDKGLTLAVHLPKRACTIQTDLESLNRILLELLTNAGKYSQPDSTVQLRVTQQVYKQGVERFVLTVSNLGAAGISSSEQTYIFDKFRRGEGVTQQAIQGTGLGLALVKSLVEHLNGTIEVKSRPADKGKSWETSFTLTLPQLFDSTAV